MSDAKTIILCSPHLTSARRKFLLVICLLNNWVNKNKKDFIQWLAFSHASLGLRPGASPSVQSENGPGACLYEVTGVHPAGSAGTVSFFHPKWLAGINCRPPCLTVLRTEACPASPELQRAHCQSFLGLTLQLLHQRCLGLGRSVLLPGRWYPWIDNWHLFVKFTFWKLEKEILTCPPPLIYFSPLSSLSQLPISVAQRHGKTLGHSWELFKSSLMWSLGWSFLTHRQHSEAPEAAFSLHLGHHFSVSELKIWYTTTSFPTENSKLWGCYSKNSKLSWHGYSRRK